MSVRPNTSVISAVDRGFEDCGLQLNKCMGPCHRMLIFDNYGIAVSEVLWVTNTMGGNIIDGIVIPARPMPCPSPAARLNRHARQLDILLRLVLAIHLGAWSRQGETALGKLLLTNRSSVALPLIAPLLYRRTGNLGDVRPTRATRRT